MSAALLLTVNRPRAKTFAAALDVPDGPRESVNRALVPPILMGDRTSRVQAKVDGRYVADTLGTVE